MAMALAYVRRGAVLVATNTDSTLPMAGTFFPGAGSVGAGVVSASGQRPLVVGKPSLNMMRAIEGRFGDLHRERTCMVGDRLNTDIRFGIEAGLGGTLMVLSGVSSKEEIVGEERGGVLPSAYVDGLGDLLAARDA